MPPTPEVLGFVRALVEEVMERDVGDNQNLREFGIDSMQVIEVLADVERRFQIKIPEPEFKGLPSITAIAQRVQDKLAAKTT